MISGVAIPFVNSKLSTFRLINMIIFSIISGNTIYIYILLTEITSYKLLIVLTFSHGNVEEDH